MHRGEMLLYVTIADTPRIGTLPRLNLGDHDQIMKVEKNEYDRVDDGILDAMFVAMNIKPRFRNRSVLENAMRGGIPPNIHIDLRDWVYHDFFGWTEHDDRVNVGSLINTLRLSGVSFHVRIPLKDFLNLWDENSDSFSSWSVKHELKWGSIATKSWPCCLGGQDPELQRFIGQKENKLELEKLSFNCESVHWRHLGSKLSRDMTSRIRRESRFNELWDSLPNQYKISVNALVNSLDEGQDLKKLQMLKDCGYLSSSPSGLQLFSPLLVYFISLQQEFGVISTPSKRVMDPNNVQPILNEKTGVLVNILLVMGIASLYFQFVNTPLINLVEDIGNIVNRGQNNFYGTIVMGLVFYGLYILITKKEGTTAIDFARKLTSTPADLFNRVMRIFSGSGK